ncbi:MAG: hypothetical protein IJ174_06160 [Clostridia bacterium]|nr:hypothetical protein [Clostridia bacterium]
MARFLTVILALLLLLSPKSPAEDASGVDAAPCGGLPGLFDALTPPAGKKTVGAELDASSVTDFYYTIDGSYFPPFYQRYRFFTDVGKRFFFHETREGGSWPQTEENTTRTGLVELTDAEWEAFLDLIRGGDAKVREEHLEDGDDGPWMYVYFIGGEADGREFQFASLEKRFAFEAFCEALREESER